MKTLVIVTHPKMERSRMNKRWVEELAKHPEKYTIHELHKVYPDEKIVFQFPFTDIVVRDS